MKLFVHNPYQEVVEIAIDGRDKVSDLKKMMTTRINGLMVPDQVLRLGVKTLIDSDTIESSGLRANSVVDLTLQKPYKISILTEDNKIHQVDVHHTNSAELVKKLLNRLLKIDVDDQRLLFNGKELKDGDILTEKSVTPGTTINLIVVNINLRLNIVRQSGQTERIEMPKNSTVDQLKQVICRKYNVPQGYALLTHNNQTLETNNKTLADYDIKDLSEINFRPKDIEIHILPSSLGRMPIAFRVFPIDTIGQVKDKIEAELKIPRNSQQLIWNGSVPGDDAILSCENIRTGSTLNLVVIVQNLTLNIQIGPADTIPIAIQSTQTVLQLKTKLLSVVNIPIAQQVLFVDNIKLEDGKILIDYGLNQTSNIALERKDSFEVQIESWSGKNISIRVHKDDKVLDMKKQIDRRLGIETDYQRLLYFGKELGDDCLEEYRIVAPCTIHLVTRVPGGTGIVFYIKKNSK